MHACLCLSGAVQVTVDSDDTAAPPCHRGPPGRALSSFDALPDAPPLRGESLEDHSEDCHGPRGEHTVLKEGTLMRKSASHFGTYRRHWVTLHTDGIVEFYVRRHKGRVHREAFREAPSRRKVLTGAKVLMGGDLDRKFAIRTPAGKQVLLKADSGSERHAWVRAWTLGLWMCLIFFCSLPSLHN